MKISQVMRVTAAITALVSATARLTLAQGTLAVNTSTEHSTYTAELFARPVTLDLKHVPLSQALVLTGRRAGVLVQYRQETLPATEPAITFHATQLPLGAAFNRILEGTGLVAIVSARNAVTVVRDTRDGVILQGAIVGRVIDARTQQSLRGATVLLDDAPRGVLTGEDGRFRIGEVNSGNHRIRIRLLGYSKQVKEVNVVDGQTVSLEVALQASANTLDQVVVTGTVAQTELKAVPNAITVITAKDLERRNITHIDQLFRGDVPGLFALNRGSGSPVGAVMMFSRGMSQMTLNEPTTQIKTYVDGVELSDPQYLSQIDPASIERIEVLTGPQASTIYGSNALNGVMQVFTKRGTNARPQLIATLQSGLIQSDFSTALTPQHNEAIQINGVDGHLSYNVGGSWIYTGRWTPGMQTTQTSGFGGGRFTQGEITVDATVRLASTIDRMAGSTQPQNIAKWTDGTWTPFYGFAIAFPQDATLNGLTLGTTLTYAPTTWWSHEGVLGNDASTNEVLRRDRWYANPSDTLLSLSQIQEGRRSWRYTTTMHLPVSDRIQSVVTGGVDAWNSSYTSVSGATRSLIGSFSTNPVFSRQPVHNRGLFMQGQLGVYDAMFLTYGLRAEWNSNFGHEAEPNLAPRYGVAYTQEIGPLTAKLRGSYGKSTRPPATSRKQGRLASQSGYNALTLSLWGDFWDNLPNPNLGPEYEQGGEGGLELYLGTRGSLVITRYNQVVDNLINLIYSADSVRSLVPIDPTLYATTYYGLPMDAQGYVYRPVTEFLNVGSIRNQGWELQSSINTGPLTTKGTYSWTKSRFLSVVPQFRTHTSTPLQPGASFGFLPEHTWALTTTYAQGATMVALAVNGVGMLYNWDQYNSTPLSTSTRLQVNRFRMTPLDGKAPTSGYATADLNASRQLSPRVQGLITIKNLSNFYRDDNAQGYGVLGRQTLLGVRVRW